MTLMTKGEFARHRGVGKSAVSNWAKKGLLVLGECPETSVLKVDVERTEARINTKLDPMRGRPTAGVPLMPAPQSDDVVDLLSGRRSAAHVRADLAEEQLIGQRLKNKLAAGELAPAVELKRRSGELGRVCRERMHSMFRSIAERLAAERDARTIMAIGGAEIDQVFSDLADEVDSGLLASDDDGAEEASIENEVAAAEEAEE
ncbi:hypothetical protein [Sphingomonas sp. PAMC 26621]|uniref:hypothetical protein n=1 Tax=Sphingomonas sp. PAMC 26621 TaxID=1112213 RepID=UPI0002898B6B|nr:hypothetical protein [Sphingomonas sp. PAMC 26621]